MFERRSALLGFISRLLDLGLTALAFPLAYWVRMRVLTRMVGSEVVRPAIYPFRILLGALCRDFGDCGFLHGHFLGIYRDIELRNRQQLVGDAAKVVILGVVALNAALYFFRADYISRAFVLTIAAVDFVLLVTGRLALLGGQQAAAREVPEVSLLLDCRTRPECARTCLTNRTK